MTNIANRLGLMLLSIALSACYARGSATVRTAGEPAPARRETGGGVVVASGEPVAAADRGRGSADGPGRGDPHEAGERGNPHDPGERGDPHDDAAASGRPASGTPTASSGSAAVDGRGRGDPHEEGERGDPHEEGERGDPHDGEAPGRGRGRGR